MILLTSYSIPSIPILLSFKSISFAEPRPSMRLSSYSYFKLLF